MKITIHSLDELYELSEVIAAGKYALAAAAQPMPSASEAQNVTPTRFESFEERDRTRDIGSEVLDSVRTVKAAQEPIEETEPNPSASENAQDTPELDADGRRWDERIDSSNKGLNKDGTWRARRNHGLSDEEVAAIKAELTVDRIKEVVGDEAWTEAMTPPDEPAVTETHPLPTDEPESERPATTETSTDDTSAERASLFELVERARKPAEDIQKDDIAATLVAAQGFIKAHSPHTFHLLRDTVAAGKQLQQLTPDERRLLLAAMELYAPDGDA